MDCTIKLLKKDGDIRYSPWEVAAEVEQLNQFAQEGTDFPRPIKCNPQALNVEDTVGDACTPPDANYRMQVRIDNYSYLDMEFFPAPPTTFTFVVGGIPEETGVFA